jgi:hypothetical protein
VTRVTRCILQCVTLETPSFWLPKPLGDASDVRNGGVGKIWGTQIPPKCRSSSCGSTWAKCKGASPHVTNPRIVRQIKCLDAVTRQFAPADRLSRVTYRPRSLLKGSPTGPSRPARSGPPVEGNVSAATRGPAEARSRFSKKSTRASWTLSLSTPPFGFLPLSRRPPLLPTTDEHLSFSRAALQ